jgi:hypothetical protein
MKTFLKCNCSGGDHATFLEAAADEPYTCYETPHPSIHFVTQDAAFHNRLSFQEGRLS